MILDGTTDADFAGTPIIELNGTSAGASVDGLKLSSTNDGSTIRGLVINRFSSDGIDIAAGSDGHTIAGNYIGLDVTGTVDLGNGNGGIESDGASTTIGGTTAADRNVIAGNTGNGIDISGEAADSNFVIGNYIGTNATGLVSLSNAIDGIAISGGADNNTIGGTSTGSGNVISGNASDGFEVSNATSTGNLIQGNIIGLNATGTADLGNVQRGIQLNDGTNTTVGGTVAGARNVISGNDGGGITVLTGASTTIQSNFIGTNAAGTTALGNSSLGIWLAAGGTTVGGTAAGAGNVISGNNTGLTVTSSSNTFRAFLDMVFSENWPSIRSGEH